MIDKNGKLQAVFPALESVDRIAMDTEADSLHSYPEKLCLIQISTTRINELIDPLSEINLDPLYKILVCRELVMHGADYDLRLLKKNGNFVPERLFDTMLAARFLGLRQFSLCQLVERYLGAKLEKTSQKANWSKRPLTERMTAYAMNDTRYLLPLHEILSKELELKGRLSWHREACQKLIIESTQPQSKKTNDVWRIKGSESLSPQALVVLRELWHWREEEAVRANKPPYFVMSHEYLIRIAESSCVSPKNIGSLVDHLPHAKREKLLKTLHTGMQKPVDQMPLRPHRVKKRFSQSAQKRFRELAQIRDKAAEQLDLEPSFIAGRGLLISLAEGNNTCRSELMQWQRELLKTDGEKEQKAL